METGYRVLGTTNQKQHCVGAVYGVQSACMLPCKLKRSESQEKKNSVLHTRRVCVSVCVCVVQVSLALWGPNVLTT